MALAIRSTRGLVETPKKGRPPILEAQFTLTKRVMDNLSAAQIRRLAIQGTKTKIKDIIKKGIRKEYKASGLKKRSGRLLRAAQNFKLDIRVSRNKIFIKARWEPKLVYFFIHLFGGIIKAKNVPLLKFKIGKQWISTEKVKIPRRNFLSFRKKVRDEIRDNVFEKVFTKELEKRLGRTEVRKEKKRIETRARKPLSTFRLRRVKQFAETVGLSRVAQRRIETAMERFGRLPTFKIGRQ